MRDDDVCNILRVNAEPFQSFARAPQERAPALPRDRLIESGVDDERAAVRFQRPNEIIERHRRLVMRIANDKILASGTLVMRITNGVNFPCSGIHRMRATLPPLCLDINNPKHVSSGKIGMILPSSHIPSSLEEVR